MVMNAAAVQPTITIVGVALILVTALGIPSAGADIAHEPLTVQRADSVGNSLTQGEVSVFLQEKTHVDDRFGSSEFFLDAQRMEIETDRSDLASGSVLETRLLVETTNEEHGGASVRGVELRDNYQFSLWPIGSGALSVVQDTYCTTFSAPTTQTVDRTPIVRESRESNQTSIENSLTWNGCDRDTNLTIQGDFLLRLWEWDAELTTDEGTKMLSSGKHNHEQSPDGLPDYTGVAGQAVEQYIYAYNATLDIPQLEGHYELYLEDPESRAAGGFQFTGTRGTLLGVELDRQEAFIQGHSLFVTLATHPERQDLRAELKGQVERFEVDGEPMEIPSQPTSRDARMFSGWAWIALLAAGIVIIGATGVYSIPVVRKSVSRDLERRRSLRYNEALDETMDRNIHRPLRAVKWARRALRLQPGNPEAQAAMALALMRQRKFKRAFRYYNKAITNFGTHHLPGTDEKIVSIWAKEAVQCLARVRFDTQDPVQREELSEQIMKYALMSWRIDSEIGRDLLEDGTISDLWATLRAQFSLERYGVHS